MKSSGGGAAKRPALEALESFLFRVEDLPAKARRRACGPSRSAVREHSSAAASPGEAAEAAAARTAAASEPPAPASPHVILPFVAPAPAKYRERYASVCRACFQASKRCDHHPERPLKLLLLGHNPSDHAWASGFFYSNPSNRMWKLLTGQSLGKGQAPFRGVLPQDCPIEDQNVLPGKFAVGLTDLGLEPGNNASDYGKKEMLRWAEGLFARLAAHRERAGAPPAFVAFTGKRQFRMMFPTDPGKLEHGEFNAPMPPGWPFAREATRIWVLPSSSGRAVMTHEARRAPYEQLAAAVHALTADPSASADQAAPPARPPSDAAA